MSPIPSARTRDPRAASPHPCSGEPDGVTALPDAARIADELAQTLARRFGVYTAVHLGDRSGRTTTALFRLAAECQHQAERQHQTECPEQTERHDQAMRQDQAERQDRAERHDQEAPARSLITKLGRVVHLAYDNPTLLSLVRGEIVHVSHADARTADSLALQLGGLWGPSLLTSRTLLLLPLLDRGMLYGYALLIRDQDRPSFTEEEIATGREFARWAARWIGSEEHAAVDELRRSLLPSMPPRPPEIELCHRYLPESRVTELGGDWFDVISLPGGRVAIVIGDVMGHGVRAAMTMSRCLTTVRTLAALDFPPEQVLQQFDNLVRLAGEEYLATCVYLVYDPAAGSCQIAGAGHVPPVLVTPDGVGRALDVGTGVPIGVGGVPFETRTFDVPDGTLLALCTDGLIDLHHQDVELGLNQLCEALSGPHRPLEEICDDVLRRLRPCDRRDDVTLLLVRLLGPWAGEGPGSPG